MEGSHYKRPSLAKKPPQPTFKYYKYKYLCLGGALKLFCGELYIITSYHITQSLLAALSYSFGDFSSFLKYIDKLLEVSRDNLRFMENN